MIKKSLFFIFLSAFLIRLIALNQSLWLDEGTTAKVIQNFSYLDIIAKFSPTDFHPPLYYLFMKFWTDLFGYSEISLRMPSVIFSLLAGFIVFKIAKLLNGYITEIWATIFFLFNPLIIYYSQEARMYMMTTFFLTASLYFFLTVTLVTRGSGSKNKPAMTNAIVLFNLFSVLAFYTFYGSIFFIAPMLIYLLYIRKYKYFIFSFLIFNFSLFILSPLLLKQFANAKESLHLVLNWKSVLGEASLKNLLLIPLKFSIGRISFYPKWLYWGVSGIFSVLVWLFVFKGGIKNKILLFLLIAPLLIGLVLSFYTPLLQYFRFLYLIPIMSLLLCFGLSSKGKLYLGGVMLAGGFFIFSSIYLLNPVFHREDWKSLTNNLTTKDKIYMITSSSDALKYYNIDLNIFELTNISKYLKDSASFSHKIIVIPYTADIYGLDYKKVLRDMKYSLLSTKTFRSLTYETWSL